MDIYIIILVSILLFLIILLSIFEIYKYLKLKNNSQSKLDHNLITSNLTNIIKDELIKINNEVSEKIIKQTKEINQLSNYISQNFNNFNNEVNTKFDIQNEKINDFKDSASKNIHDYNSKILDLVIKRLDEINLKVENSINSNFKETNEKMIEVNKHLTSIQDNQKEIEKLSTEVTNLNNILNNSQSRGKFGEVILKNLLENVFGVNSDLCALQYTLSKNTEEKDRPDAVVFCENKDNQKNILCIDSKFPFVDYEQLFNISISEKEKEESLKAFRNALRKQVDEISKKYIKPQLKTFDYAIMFIPNEGIFAYINSNNTLFREVIEYANNKKVILSSPSVLQALLITIKEINKNNVISKNIKNIIDELKKFNKENKSLIDEWNNFNKSFNKLSEQKDKFNIKVEKVNKKANNVLELAKEEEAIDNNNVTDADE